MRDPIYRHRSENGTLLLHLDAEGRWSLAFNNREVCSYPTADKAAHFVALGRTGDSRIDTMRERPRVLGDWQQ